MSSSPGLTPPSHEPVITRADRRLLPELRELMMLTDHLKGIARVGSLGNVEYGGTSFPLLTVSFGPEDPTTPVFAMFGGVHGLERIGTRVCIAFLRTIMERARWDRTILEMFKTTRLLFVPLINPVGMFLQRRSNGNGVDLMRNAPVEADHLSPWIIYGGHRLGPQLPWYRGKVGAPMEKESQAVCDFVRREIFPAKVAVSIDVHSGYGKVDRFWFPYAKSKAPLPNLGEVVAIKNLLDRTHSNHIYRIEPQSHQYMTHGDLWDFMYEEYRAKNPEGSFIPFSLELGSWLWIRKNWRQMFSLHGVFNPRLPHRVQRILRRHIPLFEFMYRAVHSHESWKNLPAQKVERLERQGRELWYGG